MKISLEWLSQYVDLSGLDPQTIAYRLTMSTAEVEGVEEIHRALDGVLACEILSVEPIPDQATLRRVEVDCGGRRFTTVCGAPNAEPGLKAAFAPAGTRIAGGKLIEAADVAGCRSEGILCSAAELGMSEFHEVLFALPAAVPAGARLADLIPASDTIIEIDNKSLTHRPDLWGHYGIAREAAAVFGRPLLALPQEDLEAYDPLPEYPLEVKDLEDCPCYCCMEIENIAPVPSPLAIQWRLHAVGQRTFDLLVDLTNYIMFELAQPMHAFDGNKLKAVAVAPMGREALFTTLDGTERKLLPEDLMIWNEKEPVALAGVMGGRNSEVGPDTKRLLLESANFKGSRIRRTAVRLGLRSEASQRFEKNQPPSNTRIGIARFLRLLHDAGAQPRVLSRCTTAGDLNATQRPIDVSMDYFHNRVGMRIPDDRIVEILHSLGFTAEIVTDSGLLLVGVPPHRSERDISIGPDIVEEVARIYGYDNIAPAMPDVPMEPAHFDDRLRLEHKARRCLAAAHRFCEIHSYSWFTDPWLKAIGYDPGETLVLKNPSAEFQSRMRTTLMPNLLASAKFNKVHRDEFGLFELGRVFRPAGPGKCDERTYLGAVSYCEGKEGALEAHFREAKGALQDLAATLNCGAFEFRPSQAAVSPWQAPGAWCEVVLKGKAVGGLGYLAGPILEEFGPKAQIAWFEIDFDQLDGPVFPEVQYDPPSPYPGSWFDVSVVADVQAGYAALEAKIGKFSHPLAGRREFVGLYKGQGVPEGKASYTFRYWIGSADHTLSGEEIQALQKDYFDFLRAEGLELR